MVHPTYCFTSFYREYLAGNQMDKLIKQHILRRVDILSFTRFSLQYIFSKFTVK